MSKENAADWIIYANGQGGWFAWNGVTHKRKDLVTVGEFTEAVAAFEREIGPYYSTR
jgi:hypothetical protein